MPSEDPRKREDWDDDQKHKKQDPGLPPAFPRATYLPGWS